MPILAIEYKHHTGIEAPYHHHHAHRVPIHHNIAQSYTGPTFQPEKTGSGHHSRSDY